MMHGQKNIKLLLHVSVFHNYWFMASVLFVMWRRHNLLHSQLTANIAEKDASVKLRQFLPPQYRQILRA